MTRTSKLGMDNVVKWYMGIGLMYQGMMEGLCKQKTKEIHKS